MSAQDAPMIVVSSAILVRPRGARFLEVFLRGAEERFEHLHGAAVPVDVAAMLQAIRTLARLENNTAEVDSSVHGTFLDAVGSAPASSAAMDTKAAAKRLETGERNVRKLAALGRIPHQRIAGRLVFEPKDLDAYAKGRA